MDLVKLLMKFKEQCSIYDEHSSEIISRGPMRTQECHHCSKPYGLPSSVSGVSGGVTRVVESERVDPNLFRMYLDSQSMQGLPPGQDIGLSEINWWMNMCKSDPKHWHNFVENCTELEISNPHQYRSSKSVYSSVSSQITSPAQSPSEQNLTSPESVTYEESSLFHTKSPNIPSLDCVNIVEDEDKRSPPGKVLLDLSHLNILPNGTVNEPERVSSSPIPNIGTVMLNLAKDPNESTIDLNQLSTVVGGGGTPSSTSGGTTNEVQQPPTTRERDLLNEKLDPKAKENAWARINQLNIDLLRKGDKEGDTQLMILLVSEKVTFEYVYVIVERLLKECPAYLSSRNDLNQDALYLAAFKLVNEPLIASYIAEALVRGKQDLNMKYDDGNTLLHCLAKQGDSHAKVLERLVKLRHPNRSPMFDINKKNNRGYSPLHVACEVHRREGVNTYQMVKVLMENGADCTSKEYKDENTPIHTLINESCDVDLLRTVLETAYKFGRRDGTSPTTVPNRQENTVLHLACRRNSLTLSHQKDVIELLLRHGAMIQLKNINGCVPSVLVDSTRKQEIKNVLHSCRQK